jgi:hypothetical protein
MQLQFLKEFCGQMIVVRSLCIRDLVNYIVIQISQSIGVVKFMFHK